jgi:hypothetical protein
MAAILQLRRGALTDFNSYGTNVSEPYFDTSRDTLQLGTTDGTGSDADWITLVKLSQANRNFTKNEPNTGSLWLTSGSDGTSGNYTGSNMILYNNIIVSGSGFIEGDLHLEGHLFLGSGSDDDVVRVQSEFSGSIVPDNDITGSTTPNSTIAYYDLGTTAKRYRNIFLQKDGTNAGFLSGSHIDLTGNIKVDGEGQFGTLRVDDLTDNRVLLAGVNGEVEDDSNLTYDGNDFNLSNSDFHQVGSGASFQFDGAGMEISGSISNNALAIDNGIVFTNVFGTLDNQNEFTWDGDFVNIVGGVTASQDLTVNRAAYLASAKVEDLTEDRIVIAGNRGEIEDDQYFRFTGANFIVGDLERFRVQVSNGNTFISGAVQMFSTLDVDGQSTHASLNVEDLTDNRVVIVGAGGEIEDDVNFTFNGTELNIGTGNFTVQQGSGNTQILGTLDVDSQSTLSSLNVQDLTSGRVVLAGTSGEIEDSGNLTFDGSLLTVTGDTTITGDLTVQGDTTQLNVSTLNVEDKNILIASGAADASAANGGGITIDGADATILYSSGNDSFQLNKQLQVEGNISGSSFGGTTLLSSSNENFADYSQSVDSRLDSIEGPMSSSIDTRLIEIFATGSDHETRLDLQESHSSSFTSNDLDMNGNKVLFGNVYSTEGDLPAAGTYHGMFAHVHGTGKGYFAHGGNWIPLLNESTFTTDSASFDSRLDAQESFSTSLDDTFATEAEVNSATSSLSSSLAVDIASNLSEITNLNSFSSSIDTTIKTKLDTEAIVSGSEFTGSVNITDSMNLAAQDPLPSGNIGDLAVSGSNLFFYNGAWTQVV